jgi:hypothetical protein
MSAGDEHVSEVPKLPTHWDNMGQGIANEINRYKSKLALAFLENHSAGFERVMDAGGFAILTEAGHKDRFATTK